MMAYPGGLENRFPAAHGMRIGRMNVVPTPYLIAENIGGCHRVSDIVA